MPPKSISPFAALEAEVLGTYEMPRVSDWIVPCENRLSVTVGTSGVPDTVPAV